MASFVWTIFLAYMKQLDAEALKNGETAQVDVFDKLWSSLTINK
jgi:hypothetical protein